MKGNRKWNRPLDGNMTEYSRFFWFVSIIRSTPMKMVLFVIRELCDRRYIYQCIWNNSAVYWKQRGKYHDDQFESSCHFGFSSQSHSVPIVPIRNLRKLYNLWWSDVLSPPASTRNQNIKLVYSFKIVGWDYNIILSCEWKVWFSRYETPLISPQTGKFKLEWAWLGSLGGHWAIMNKVIINFNETRWRYNK